MPEFTQWDYQGSFLSQFPKHTQSTIANLFCNAVRQMPGNGWPKTVKGVIAAVEWDLIQRQENGYENCLTPIMGQLHDAVIDPDSDAANFAEFILWRESLTPEAKVALKRSKGAPYAQQFMAQQLPSEAQLQALKKMGVTDMPASKLQASEWIEKICGKGGR